MYVYIGTCIHAADCLLPLEAVKDFFPLTDIDCTF